jgi:hypothetical protein
MLARASPRKPRVEIRSRSSSPAILLVEWRRGVLAVHARAVILNLDHALAAVDELDADLRGPGVERVLDELLDDRNGAFDDLAGGDLLGHAVRQEMDLPHPMTSPSVRRGRT